MNCLSIERIYAYLEGELSSAENRDFEVHLDACPKCRDAFEERRRMLQAIESLPAFEVPPDFAEAVMDRISAPPAKSRVPFIRWTAAALAGVLALIAVLSGIALVTGQNLFQFFLGFNRGLWSFVQDATSALAKLAKFTVLFFKIIQQFFEELTESLRAITSWISPEAQVMFVCVSLLLILAGGILWGRRFLVEKNHEK